MKNLIKRLINLKQADSLPFTGPYSDWEAAIAASVGYDSPFVLKKVYEAVESVLSGEFTYERDGTVFKEFPEKNKLRFLLKQITRKNDIIVDFGGGLGGTFINNRDVIGGTNCSKYFVVEQLNFCQKGGELAETYGLPIVFLPDLHSLTVHPDIVIFSGVLHCLENWNEIVLGTLRKSPSYIIIDRLPITSGKSVILVQENPGYYEKKVSYPSWTLNKKQVISSFVGYDVMEEWQSDFDAPHYRGFLLKKAN